MEEPMPNPVVHFEFISPDAEALQRFFSDVFDWMIDAGNPMNYGMVDTGVKDYGIQGGVGAPGPFGSGHVTIYVEVEDIDTALAKIAAAGGEIVMPKMTIPGSATTLAQFRAPTGHIIGLSERHAAPAPAAAPKPARKGTASKGTARKAAARRPPPRKAAPKAKPAKKAATASSRARLAQGKRSAPKRGAAAKPKARRGSGRKK
jgi:hypothetical protein